MKLTGFNLKKPERTVKNIDPRSTGWKHPNRSLCGCAASSRAQPERPLRHRGYLQGSASNPGDTHRRPVDEVWPPPPSPGGEAWAPAPTGAPQPLQTRALALPEGAQQQPRGRHVGPEAAPARWEPPPSACAVEERGAGGSTRGACAVGASKTAMSPGFGFWGRAAYGRPESDWFPSGLVKCRPVLSAASISAAWRPGEGGYWDSAPGRWWGGLRRSRSRVTERSTAGPRTQPGCVLARGRPREGGEGPARGLARVKRKDVEKEGRRAPPTRAQSGISFYRCSLSSKITVSWTSYLVLEARWLVSESHSSPGGQDHGPDTRVHSLPVGNEQAGVFNPRPRQHTLGVPPRPPPSWLFPPLSLPTFALLECLVLRLMIDESWKACWVLQWKR